MNEVLWVLQIVLAGVLLGTGLLKLLESRRRLDGSMPWTRDLSRGSVRLLGAAELAGAVGLAVPPLFDVAPILSPWAAVGIAVLSLAAVVFHVRRGERRDVVLPLGLLVVAVVIAWGRFGPYWYGLVS